MALITCSQCGHKVSDKANHCPHCGKKVEKKFLTKTRIVIGIISLVAIVAIIVSVYFFYLLQTKSSDKVSNGVSNTSGISNFSNDSQTMGNSGPEEVGANVYNGSEYVDLGLPSGTLWKKVNEPGGLYTYDRAIREFGRQLPTKEQWEEIQYLCQWIWTGSFVRVVGPNGNTIELYLKGIRYCDGELDLDDSYGCFWSSTPYDSEDSWFIEIEPWDTEMDMYEDVDMDYDERCNGFSVRLVQQK